MQFVMLASMNPIYATEVGTSGKRPEPGTWTVVQDRLMRALRDLRALDPPPETAPKQASGSSVAALRQFHEAQIRAASVQKQPDRESKRKTLLAEIAWLRNWLAREGAWADGNGQVYMGNMDAVKVEWDSTPEAQKATCVSVQGGLVYDAQQKPLDTRGMVSHFTGPGRAIFVLSPKGQLHISTHVVGHRHHSSLLAGSRVACAGEIQVDKGCIRWMSNKSGHYLPEAPHVLQLLHLLRKKGVALNFKLVIHDDVSQTTYATAQAYVDQQAGSGNDYEVAKLRAYSPYLTETNLAPVGWRKQDVHGQPCVYDEATGTPVPPKEVRNYLKKLPNVKPSLTIKGL